MFDFFKEFSSGNIKQCMDYINSGEFNLSVRNHEGLTPLEFAIKSNAVEIARTIIQRHPEALSIPGDNGTPFFYAIKLGNPAMIDVFIKDGRQTVDQRDGNKRTAFHIAAETLNLESAQTLVALDPKIIEKTTNPSALSLVVLAPLNNKDPIPFLNLLLAHGLDVLSTDSLNVFESLKAKVPTCSANCYVFESYTWLFQKIQQAQGARNAKDMRSAKENSITKLR